MRFAIVGTGFVADYYMTTLANHPQLELAGAFDVDQAHLKRFCDYHGAHGFQSLDEILKDNSITMIAVLTTPESHFAIAKAALGSGKHVYCEKPLAMDLRDAKALVALASENSLVLGGAPANAHSDAFALTKSALETGNIGKPRLVYAEMEDGPVFRQDWQLWRSHSGAPWPGKHEFEIGCTLEHAGYALSWLIGLFGSIRTIHGTSGTFFFDKGADILPEMMAPDFSTACLTFESGVVARLTCGLCAPRDRSLTVMGEGGTLTVADLWDNRSAIHVEKPGEKSGIAFRIARRLEAKLGRVLPLRLNAGQRIAYPAPAKTALPSYPSQIDFCAGLAAVADCANGQGDAATLAATALHVTEAALALNRISEHGGHYEMECPVLRT